MACCVLLHRAPYSLCAARVCFILCRAWATIAVLVLMPCIGAMKDPMPGPPQTSPSDSLNASSGTSAAQPAGTSNIPICPRRRNLLSIAPDGWRRSDETELGLTVLTDLPGRVAGDHGAGDVEGSTPERLSSYRAAATDAPLWLQADGVLLVNDSAENVLFEPGVGIMNRVSCNLLGPIQMSQVQRGHWLRFIILSHVFDISGAEPFNRVSLDVQCGRSSFFVRNSKIFLMSSSKYYTIVFSRNNFIPDDCFISITINFLMESSVGDDYEAIWPTSTKILLGIYLDDIRSPPEEIALYNHDLTAPSYTQNPSLSTDATHFLSAFSVIDGDHAVRVLDIPAEGQTSSQRETYPNKGWDLLSMLESLIRRQSITPIRVLDPSTSQEEVSSHWMSRGWNTLIRSISSVISTALPIDHGAPTRTEMVEAYECGQPNLLLIGLSPDARRPKTWKVLSSLRVGQHLPRSMVMFPERTLFLFVHALVFLLTYQYEEDIQFMVSVESGAGYTLAKHEFVMPTLLYSSDTSSWHEKCVVPLPTSLSKLVEEPPPLECYTPVYTVVPIVQDAENITLHIRFRTTREPHQPRTTVKTLSQALGKRYAGTVPDIPLHLRDFFAMLAPTLPAAPWMDTDIFRAHDFLRPENFPTNTHMYALSGTAPPGGLTTPVEDAAKSVERICTPLHAALAEATRTRIPHKTHHYPNERSEGPHSNSSNHKQVPSGGPNHIPAEEPGSDEDPALGSAPDVDPVIPMDTGSIVALVAWCLVICVTLVYIVHGTLQTHWSGRERSRKLTSARYSLDPIL